VLLLSDAYSHTDCDRSWEITLGSFDVIVRRRASNALLSRIDVSWCCYHSFFSVLHVSGLALRFSLFNHWGSYGIHVIALLAVREVLRAIRFQEVSLL
jgi:hypothetical protein